ncbi:hypothetical protein Tco_0756475 [Tanacetum coccineum]
MFIEVKRCENVICYIQAEEEEQARLEREKAEKVKEANISWDNVQAMIEVDRLLDERLPERGAEEIEQMRENKSFAEIPKLFDKAMTRVNMFVDKDTELVKESSKKAEAGDGKEESSSKRAGDES